MYPARYLDEGKGFYSYGTSITNDDEVRLFVEGQESGRSEEKFLNLTCNSNTP